MVKILYIYYKNNMKINNLNSKNNNFFLYARKSSENEERQIQSIGDQLNVMRKKAKAMWINIIDEFTESMSAKAPWRYRFNEMIERLKKGEANWIISWKLDRLTRNPIDTWTIQFMLQKREILMISTNDKDYLPEDSWLIMSVETWMANQYILDLIKNVKRWLDSKYEKWIRPTKAPLWYINDKNNYWLSIEDPDRWHIIRKMWDYMLTWNYLAPQILDIANNDWGLRTRIRKNWWWQPLSRSSIYRIFNSMFYAWYFPHNWETKKGIHKAMVSLEEYDRVQVLLGKKWNCRPKNYEFSYTWMIRCWECWNMITAEIKNKIIKSTWEYKQYIYYHCSKRSKNIKCAQKTIRLEKLEKQIFDILLSIEIIPEIKDWCVSVLKENNNDEVAKRLKLYNSIGFSINREEKKLKNLTDLLLDEVIDKEEFIDKKESIKMNIERLKEERGKVDIRGQKLLDSTEEVFEFACTARDNFMKWNLKEKKSIFKTLGQNFVLKDWVLALELYPWLKVLEKELKNRDWWIKRLELTKNSTSSRRTNAISVDCIKWWELLFYQYYIIH